MKICAIVCEYNPFHNGHLYQLQLARSLSGADAVVCVMSGNFTQRGEPAIAEKHVRAAHAIQAGADAVLELPCAFSTSNAELFSKGAIKILSSIPLVKTLCFGAENADATAFLNAAKLLNNEPKEVSQRIKTLISTGTSYAKARAAAWSGLIDQDLLSSPNNILGLEYTKALLAIGANIQILPIQRKGSGYSDAFLKENFSSATAIRNAIFTGESVSGNLPDFVKKDLTPFPLSQLETLEKHAILSTPTEALKKVCDCTEGLENALKKAAEQDQPLTEILTSARYTSSRIRRIALQNLLKIDETLIRESLCSPLYLRVLAVKKDNNRILSALGESSYPIIARAHDEEKLQGAAKRCFECDVYAEKIYALLTNRKPTKKKIFI
jgi:predicted nucleotidyltransferase